MNELKKNVFAIAFVATGFLIFGCASAAIAQDIPQVISPLQSVKDINGVNLTDGEKMVELPTLSVPADPRLKFDRVENAAPYVHGNIVIPSSGPATAAYSIHRGEETSESFTCDQTGCGSTSGSGSQFTTMNSTYAEGRYRIALSGELYTFDDLSTDVAAPGTPGAPTKRTVQSYASSVNYPDGETISYTYDKAVLPQQTLYRPTKISSNTGYYIKITYRGNDINQPDEWSGPDTVGIYSPSDSTTPIRQFKYGADGSIIDTGFNNGTSSSRTFYTTGVPNSLPGGIESINASVTLPSESAAQLSLSPGQPPNSGGQLLSTLTRDGVVWNYNYVNRRYSCVTNALITIYDSVTVTGPNNYNVVYQMGHPGGCLYGIQQLVQSQTDELGHVTSYSYDPDAGNRLIGITYPENNSVTLHYDNDGNIDKKTSTPKPGSTLAPLVESASYTDCTVTNSWNVNCWRPNSYTDALNRVTKYQWNADGQMTQELSPADNNGVKRETDTTYTPNAVGISLKNLVRVCGQTTTCAGNAESHTEYATYWNNTGLPLTVTVKDEVTGLTETTTYTYDNAGRVLSVQPPMNGVSGAKYFTYDAYGRKSWEIGAADANGVRVAKRFTYRDSDDKVTRVETGTTTCPTNCNTDTLTLAVAEQTDTQYDTRRYPIRDATSSAGTNYHVVDRSFLDRGLADCTTVRMNLAALQTPTSTSACSLYTTGQDGPDRITKNNYDNAGQLTKVQQAYQVTTANGFPQTLQADYVSYLYTPNGKQQYVTDANGNKAQYTWDGFDRLSQWNFPSPSAAGTVSSTDYEFYAYDAVGNRLTFRRRDGRTLTFNYDNLNRVLDKLIPDGCPPIQPTGTGCPDPLATRDVHYDYDILGRLHTAMFDRVSGPDGVTNTYDGFGNLKSSTLSMFGVTKTLNSNYNLNNNRKSIAGPNGYAAWFGFDTRDTFTSAVDATGGTSAIIGLDGLGRITSLGLAPGATSWAGYHYDGASRVQTVNRRFAVAGNDVNLSFGYNAADQITSESRDSDVYAYTDLTNFSRGYQVNGLNQYTSTTSATFTYDANGNLTTDGTNSYIYDGENRLVSMTTGSNTDTLTYDPLGRLYEVKVTQGTCTSSCDIRFLTDGDQIVAEYDGSDNLLRSYVHAPGEDRPLEWLEGSGTSDRRLLSADHEGSIVAVMGASGNKIALNSYDEYGLPGSANQGLFQYTGQAYLSKIGLYYYKARMYSPVLGRFMQTDPIGYKDQVNLYEYVGDDPEDKTDPMGLFDCPDQNQCNSISGAIKVAKEEALRPETGSRLPSARGQDIARSLNALGTAHNVALGQHDPNGVSIASGNLSKGTYGETTGSHITLDFRQINAAGVHNGGGLEVAAGVLVHEATHYSDALKEGQPRDNEVRFNRERHAFANQSYIYYKLGIAPFGFGFPRWGTDRYSTDLSNTARRDCESENQDHPMQGGCQ